jgi:two-component system NtrC family sensor kinase
MPVTEPTARAALDVLGQVAAFLGASLSVEGVMGGVAGALKRGLDAQSCTIWIRAPDGATLRAVPAPGDPPIQAAPAPARLATMPGDWTPADPYLRVPLVYQGERLGLLELRLRSDTGLAIWREVTGTVANILAPLLSTLELSQDLAGEVALRTREIEAQRRFTIRIIDSLPVGLYVVDRDYRIQAWNRKREAGTQGISREEAIGRPVFDVLHRQPRDLLKREFDGVFETGEIEEVEVRTEAPQGGDRYYRIRKIPMRLDDQLVSHVITIGEDITEAKMVQQQISQTEKLAAVGQLAAGVMHEINNPLATIGACVEALSSRVDGLPPTQAQPLQEYLEIVSSELSRCKSIVDGLLDFSRPKARAKYPVAINQVVEDALFLVRYHDRFKRIRLVRKLSDDLPPVEANAEQLIQVFLDLMLNAIDAMDGRGTLTVATQLAERPDEVLVEISDTGMGIRREDIAKIFEPFFTTKAPGQGTGLGLSISYAIVQHHGGRIQVDSQLGSGSTFRVTLPVHVPEAS